MSFTYEYNRLFLTVMMAVLTGVGGGVIRDIFVGDVPFIFRKEIYAVASIIGAVCFFYTKTTAFREWSHVFMLFCHRFNTHDCHEI